MPLPAGTRAVLTDIEGTTTPVAFVYEVLFPYAAARLEGFAARAAENDAENHAEDSKVAAAFDGLRRELVAERGGPAAGHAGISELVAYARSLMAGDRKSTALKELQGLIWRRGYEEGSLAGEVFSDVPPALAAWRQAGLRLRVFSSGSILAQKLLFSTTAHGDLTRYFEGFHDTTTGPKAAAQSYRAIAAAFGEPATAILFLSDVTAELDAAAEAGLATGLLVRPGNRPADPGAHPRYESFAELV